MLFAGLLLDFKTINLILVKKFLFTLYIIIATVLFTAAQKAEVTPDGFFIKNKPISKTTTPSELRDLLGIPDRVFSLTNIIWSYDKSGIYIYLNPADSSIKHISFDLVKHEQKFSPLKPFNGIFILHKTTTGRYTSLAKLMKMKSLRFEENPVWLNPAYTGNVKLYFEFDDNKKLLRSIGVALVFKSNPE